MMIHIYTDDPSGSCSKGTTTRPAVFQDAADVFDVDPLTGFMPSLTPLPRLYAQWEPWEAILDDAIAVKLQVGDKIGITEEDKAKSEAWRDRVRQLPLLSTKELDSGSSSSSSLSAAFSVGRLPLLRRAHLVLAYIMHFYIQSLPSDALVVVPRAIALPILRVSARLDIPPVLTYSDTVLYNWITSPLGSNNICHQISSSAPTIDNVRSQTLFSGLPDEEAFYLCSARIELRGVDALSLIRRTMDDIFLINSSRAHSEQKKNDHYDTGALQRIALHLFSLAGVIDDLHTILDDVRTDCRPQVYYDDVRPWFRGEDSDENGRRWVFEGVDDSDELDNTNPEDAAVSIWRSKHRELSGPSAGQSSIVHVLDVFLGVDHQRPTGTCGSSGLRTSPLSASSAPTSPTLSLSLDSSIPSLDAPPLICSTIPGATSLAPKPSSTTKIVPHVAPHLPTLALSLSAPAAVESSSSCPSSTSSHNGVAIGNLNTKKSFMSRMQTYMPRPHRHFLDNLSVLTSSGSAKNLSLRSFVLEEHDDHLRAAYNAAVRALKEFRDAHMVVAALYIVGPARRRERLRTLGRASCHGGGPSLESPCLAMSVKVDKPKFTQTQIQTPIKSKGSSIMLSPLSPSMDSGKSRPPGCARLLFPSCATSTPTTVTTTMTATLSPVALGRRLGIGLGVGLGLGLGLGLQKHERDPEVEQERLEEEEKLMTGKQVQQPMRVEETPLKGTGGTDLVRFLKDTRNRTSETLISTV